MENKRLLAAWADESTAEALRKIAVNECDGNASQALRRAVREAAERRGVLVETVGAQPTQEGGGHV